MDQETITSAVKTVAVAMQDAIAEYGPQAADMALLAYRVQAAQNLAESLIGLALVFFVQMGIFKIWWPYVATLDVDSSDRSGLRWTPTVIIGLISMFIFFGALSNLIYVPYWLALLGYPEVLIAIKALAAANLM